MTRFAFHFELIRSIWLTEALWHLLNRFMFSIYKWLTTKCLCAHMQSCIDNPDHQLCCGHLFLSLDYTYLLTFAWWSPVFSFLCIDSVATHYMVPMAILIININSLICRLECHKAFCLFCQVGQCSTWPETLTLSVISDF